MTIRKVLRAGHPGLRRENNDVPKKSIGEENINQLVGDMFATMHDYDGVGLAAPQVQENVKLLVYEIQENERYDSVEKPVGPTVMINPEILDHSQDCVEDWEGCLSFPKLRGFVPRYRSIKVRYLDRSGEERISKPEGFESRVIQHELDHLEGRLFPERMNDLSSLCYLEEYRKYHAEDQ